MANKNLQPNAREVKGRLADLTALNLVHFVKFQMNIYMQLDIFVVKDKMRRFRAKIKAVIIITKIHQKRIKFQ